MTDFIYEVINSNCVLRACAIAVIICFNWFYDHITFFKKVGIIVVEFIFIFLMLAGMPIFFLMFR